MKKFKISAMLLFAAMLMFSACGGGGGGSDDPGAPGDPGDKTISISTINGVNVPVKDAVPVTEIIETDQYTGTVSWSDSPAKFVMDTVYTATITLTAKSGYTFSGIAANYFTVSGAASVTNSANSGEITVVFPKIWVTYNLQDIGPAGGHIFYINPNAATDGWKYLEAAPKSTEWVGKVWGGYDTSVSGINVCSIPYGEGWDAVGAGKQNTIAIVSLFGDKEPYENKSDYAAKLCSDLVFGGHDDWFLPSHGELRLIEKNLKDHGVGGFENPNFSVSDRYWSSTELNCVQVLDQGFEDGYMTSYKNMSMRVRAVRQF